MSDDQRVGAAMIERVRAAIQVLIDEDTGCTRMTDELAQHCDELAERVAAILTVDNQASDYRQEREDG